MPFPRRLALLPLVLLSACASADKLAGMPSTADVSSTTVLARVPVADHGAVGDGITVNTAALQSAIDALAARGGGTLVFPAGVFRSGALDLRPGVHLHLEKGAVLRAVSADVATHFPQRLTRIEGRNQFFTPALLNAARCDGLRITGEGVIDGDGRPVWDEFWKRFNADKTTKNLDVPRARLAFIADSKDVLVEGVTFKDSQFWNLHLYRCQNVAVRGASFVVPDDYKQAPSTDGIDIDSSQDVLIEGCHFSVTDDCVAMKGSKGPLADQDADSPPVERVVVRDCVFRRGHAGLTLGSEATVVRDVTLETSRVTGAMYVLHVKLRPDTPQTYERIRVRDVALDDSGGRLVQMAPWKQYFDLAGHPPPQSTVRDILVERVTGRYGAFGTLEGNRGQTSIDGVVFRDLDLALGDAKLKTRDVHNLRIASSTINGQPIGGGAAPKLPPATLSDVAYGSHPRQVLDFYRAEGATPRPAVVYLHGGGWLNGDKKDIAKRDVAGLQAAGISVVSISYRYVSQARAAGVVPPVRWPMEDVARAVQFVRSRAAEWNIDKTRIAGAGGSAGACSVLWLALHDDLADPASPDPVARESTRFYCVALDGAQTSLDPREMREWTPNSRYGAAAFGFDRPAKASEERAVFEEFWQRRDEFLPAIKEYSPIERATADDPPLYLWYKAPPALGRPDKDATHSANFGVKLKEKLDPLGVDCILYYPGAADARYTTLESYLIAQLRPATP